MAGPTGSPSQLQHRCQVVRGEAAFSIDICRAGNGQRGARGGGGSARSLQILGCGMFVLTWIDDLRYVLIHFGTEGLFHLRSESLSWVVASFDHRRCVATLAEPSHHSEYFTPEQIICRLSSFCPDLPASRTFGQILNERQLKKQIQQSALHL